MSQARGADLRGLKALVAGLGVLVVLGTAVVVGVVIKRIYSGPGVASIVPGGGPVPGVGAVVAPAGALDLPAGSRIAGVAAAGGVFAVWVTGGGGDQLWIVNPQTGAHFVTLNAPK